MKTSERDMAREFRSDGLSVREIERRLGVSRSSVSRWVRDVDLTAVQSEALRLRPRRGRDRFRLRRIEYQDAGRATAQCREPLHAIGCMLFWAEGSLEQFWLDELELPRTCLTKSAVNVYSRHGKRKRLNKLPYGTAT